MFLFEYKMSMAKAYPRDVRIFAARLLPILIERYDYPIGYDKKALNDLFWWGENLWDKTSTKLIGTEEEPHVILDRGRYGDVEWTDEYEETSLELVNFSPPHVDSSVNLLVECCESFFEIEMGSYTCQLELSTDDEILYNILLEAIRKIEGQFKNAVITIEKEYKP